MFESAVLCSQSGEVTHGLRALVSAHGFDVTTLTTSRPEDNRWYLSPATVERVERRIGEAEAPLLVVDGVMHPGQMADLQARLPSFVVRDRRGAVWNRLGASNPVAAARFELQQARVKRRNAASAQRSDAASGPTGTSGRLAAADQRVQRQRARLDGRQETARRRIQTSYTDTDGRLVVLGRVAAPTTDLWTGLTDDPGDTAAGRPAQPTTATTTIGPHTLAVTDTPGIPGDRGVPDWFDEAVPGVAAALEVATVVLGVGGRCGALLSAVDEQFDVSCRELASPDTAAARRMLRDLLGTDSYAIQLPYSDASHGLVSELHDRGIVHEIEYEDAIYLHVEVSGTAGEELRRDVGAIGGEVTTYPTGE